ncbi:sn-glycerol-1-phosphate dehydrogenase [Paenactinomyces guangxiensis]|uniref:sn-glycerol-1-phosphate dehydrogenase n=2 Tax=Paenactinomyces guangxiensis TaxID=1490290 RepID=A0A7W1WNB4_9BACL|nr:sn-glycerol-1-phosphate dehydrogenase [Paenactinomyces guangxiensis]MBH8590107.1 sn-glycerol-1-phosphate dehydrogenase [Paenactinomyces guangxiensis]
MHIVTDHGALAQVTHYLRQRDYHSVAVVADRNTFAAAGQTLCQALSREEISFHLCVIQENEWGDVIADEASIVQVLLEVPKDENPILAVGAGTIHDIVRFVSYQTDKPFISVPTAASVDGFTSAGAPLVIRKMKKTVQAAPPAAVFADLDIIGKAPKALNAAGFGDMLGKFTSLADWRFSRHMAQEPFCPLAYQITKEALFSCISHIEEIANASAEGLRALTAALLKSGLSMLLARHSRPASGAEHHLSHVWEMELLKENKKQLLHGAKVGVASVVISELYQKLSRLDAGVTEGFFTGLPDPDQLRRWLRKAGAPADLEELNISREFALQSLKKAHTIRDRYTGLKYMNEHGLDLFQP